MPYCAEYGLLAFCLGSIANVGRVIILLGSHHQKGTNLLRRSLHKEVDVNRGEEQSVETPHDEANRQWYTNIVIDFC